MKSSVGSEHSWSAPDHLPYPSASECWRSRIGSQAQVPDLSYTSQFFIPPLPESSLSSLSPCLSHPLNFVPRVSGHHEVLGLLSYVLSCRVRGNNLLHKAVFPGSIAGYQRQDCSLGSAWVVCLGRAISGALALLRWAESSSACPVQPAPNATAPHRWGYCMCWGGWHLRTLVP